MHIQIEAQASQSPDSRAIAFEAVSWTRGELNARSSSVAACLRTHGIGRGMLVAICIDRGPDMVAALLGVLKSGAAYVPIDPDNPDDRIAWILADTSTRVLLTCSRLARRFAGANLRILCVDDDNVTSFQKEAGDSPVVMDDIAYCIYTSGSTGRPKGALNTHRGLANLVHWYTRRGLSMTPDDCILLASSIGFDLTQKNIFGPLTVGATLAIPPCSPADAVGFLRAMSLHQPTWLNCAPSAFRAFATSPRTRSLRIVVLGGEPLDSALEAELVGRPLTLVNSYGPTECADVVLWHARSMQDAPAAGEMPLGRPIPGVRIYILDERLQPVADGVAGEIHVAGVGVGVGYLGQPVLTNEKFIADPFGTPGSRMYKTGDLGRRNADGEVEFLGRIDFQVKIRGHRIELGEIESRLLEIDGVSQAAVVAHEVGAGDKRLVAYVAGAELVPEDLRHALLKILPEYMVPLVWILMDSLPLNLNGKIDRKGLPAPEWSQSAQAA